MKQKCRKFSKKLFTMLVSLVMLIALLPTTTLAKDWPGGGGGSTFNHLDIKTAGSFAYLDQNDNQKTVGITWTKSNMIKYMKIYIGEGSTQNVVPATTNSSGWGSGGGSDENRISVKADKEAPVRVVIEIPVTALGLTNDKVSDLYETNAQGIKVFEYEGIYYWSDNIPGVSNICPNKSGLDVLISSTALIDYAKYGTIEVKKVVENADGSVALNDNTTFSFKITSADGSFSETFSLKNGEFKKYESLPVGVYYVDELNVPNGYTVKGYNREVVLKEANEYKALTVTNVKKDSNKGALTVGKILSETDSVNLPADATFTFTVAGSGVNQTFSLTKADITAGKVSYTFANLTPGNYTVTESAAYTNGEMIKTTTATVQVGSGNASNADLSNDGLTAAVVKGQTTSVRFTNSYDAKPVTYPVIVNYYKDSVTNPGDAAHFLGTQNLGNYENGDTITLNGAQLDAYKPADGYNSGVQQGTVPYTVVKGADNIINVLYEVETFEVIVNYYKDSVTNPGDAAHFLGTQNLGNYENGDTITLNAAQLDAYKPANGYVSGVQQGAVPYVVVSSDDNVINVLYIAETFPVTVNYYKDSVTNPDDAATFLGSSVFAEEFKANSEITLVDGTAATQLDFLKPVSGYNSGLQDGDTPYVVVKGDNVINVVYYEEEIIVDPEPPLVGPAGPTDPVDLPEEEIPDEDVPLAPPKTGDAVLPAALAVLIALMAAGGVLLRKKADSEEK